MATQPTLPPPRPRSRPGTLRPRLAGDPGRPAGADRPAGPAPGRGPRGGADGHGPDPAGRPRRRGPERPGRGRGHHPGTALLAGAAGLLTLLRCGTDLPLGSAGPDTRAGVRVLRLATSTADTFRSLLAATAAQERAAAGQDGVPHEELAAAVNADRATPGLPSSRSGGPGRDPPPGHGGALWFSLRTAPGAPDPRGCGSPTPRPCSATTTPNGSATASPGFWPGWCGSPGPASTPSTACCRAKSPG
ncbi:hypothetical protein HFP43_21005 [Streptomyces sp. SJ1-7]|nr:hypothetical protein [Streptomyces sp. SJ1-7]